MALTWVSCGIDYPKLVEGEADYVLYHSAAPWDHVPGSAAARRGGWRRGHARRVAAYRPRDIAPPGLVAAADHTAYERVCRALASSAHLR